MRKYYFKKLSQNQLKNLCQRKRVQFEKVFPLVKKILKEVKLKGDKALREYTKKFDKVDILSFKVSQREIEKAQKRIPHSVKFAFKKALSHIKKFHKIQIIRRKIIKIMPGVISFFEMRPIEKVGFYIPGGKAPLASTLLMLAVPAKLAGCKEIVVCTPPRKDGRVPEIILFAAKLCGITKIFKIGGVQAIGALAYGTETIPKVDKIFGPGNQYVTAAKILVSIDPEGAVVDFPAGPTEVLIIADEKSRADFVASEILAQLEHGSDSQAILVAFSEKKANEILEEIKRQLKILPRKEIAKKALNNSFSLIVDSLEEAIAFSNMYAPEHLILNVKNPEKYLSKIFNAGSVFLGSYSSVSAGDYATGTNHCLPTSGYAKFYGSLSVNNFQKLITFQKITKKGCKNLSPIISQIAKGEFLEGHKKALEIRL